MIKIKIQDLNKLHGHSYIAGVLHRTNIFPFTMCNNVYWELSNGH